MAARFLAWVAGWSLALSALLAAATAYLDPAGLRASRRTSTCAPMRMWKMPAFERSGARTVFVGTSRVALGMDATPAGPLGPAVFNLALPASKMPEVARVAAGIVAHGSVDSVLLGLDYGMFIGAREPGPGPGEQARGGHDAAPLAAGGWPSRAEMRQALNLACTPYELDPRSGTVWWRESNAIAFENALRLQLSAYARCIGGACAAHYRASLEALRTLVRQAARSNVRLTVFINPLPALHLEGIRLSGARPQFERWKRDVAAIVQEDGGARASPVRDFAVFASEARHSRPTPAAASESSAGFLDVSHYTIGLGRIVQHHLASSSDDALFGAPLRLESLGRHLERDRLARNAWAAEHREQVARLRAALAVD